MPSFIATSTLAAPAAEVFAWHLRDGAFEALLPPGDGTRIESRTGSIETNTMRVVLRVPVLGPIRQRWTIRHEGYEADRRFVDVLERGPFPHWRHEHLVEPVDEHSSVLIDTIEYRMPLGPLGQLFGGWIVGRRLRGMFAYRHAVMRETFGDARSDERD